MNTVITKDNYDVEDLGDITMATKCCDKEVR